MQTTRLYNMHYLIKAFMIFNQEQSAYSILI